MLPVGHGPGVEGESVRIIDADTDQSVAAVPMRTADTSWRYWAISLPSRARRLRIVAEDASATVGHWAAVGQPLRCASSY
jgi:hypothetical protein